MGESKELFGYDKMRRQSDRRVLTGQKGDVVECIVIVASFSPFFWWRNVMDTDEMSVLLVICDNEIMVRLQ